MCKWGNSVYMELVVQPEQSFDGKARMKVVAIDTCIAPMVKALNNAGIVTISSCCGHGKSAGSIMLADGRELIIKKESEK